MGRDIGYVGSRLFCTTLAISTIILQHVYTPHVPTPHPLLHLLLSTKMVQTLRRGMGSCRLDICPSLDNARPWDERQVSTAQSHTAGSPPILIPTYSAYSSDSDSPAAAPAPTPNHASPVSSQSAAYPPDSRPHYLFPSPGSLLASQHCTNSCPAAFYSAPGKSRFLRAFYRAALLRLRSRRPSCCQESHRWPARRFRGGGSRRDGICWRGGSGVGRGWCGTVRGALGGARRRGCLCLFRR